MHVRDQACDSRILFGGYKRISSHLIWGTYVESSLPSKPDPTNPVRDRLLFSCARLSAVKLKQGLVTRYRSTRSQNSCRVLVKRSRITRKKNICLIGYVRRFYAIYCETETITSYVICVST